MMKNKLKSNLIDNKYILFTGLTATFVILFVYFCYSIIPFGDRTIYRMDLYHQYGPLFSELYDRITSGESLLYSWNSGIGSSFIGNFFNYLSSPFAVLVLIFGHENTFEAVAAMIACKAVLSSMSMSYYLKKSHNSNGPELIAFGIMYAFCGYFIAYYWNVMWIDAMYLLPFVILSIEKIINEGKCTYYIVALALSIYCNYYIGFMICIFSCIYFLYYYYCSLDNFDKRHKVLKYKEEKDNKIKNSFFLNSGIRFALSSFAAALILCGMLIPVAYVLSSSSATSSTFPSTSESYFDFFDFLANHLASLEPTIRSSGEDVLPNVYCGMLTLILIPVFLLSKKISSKEKVASVVLLAIMYFSFNINIFNFVWHGLHFPNDLPYRQSFMYSFMLVIMAHKAFKAISDFNKKYLIGIGVCLVIFILAVYKVGSKNVSLLSVVLSIIFVILLVLVLILLAKKQNQVYALTILLVCSVVAETIVCSTKHYVANQKKTSFTVDYDDFKDIQNNVHKNDSDLFYREELSYLRTRMDPCWYDYNGVSVFSSMAYERVANYQKAIGLYGNKINSFTYNPNSPVYNAMFSVKYIYDRRNLVNNGTYYTKIGENDSYNVYENKYHLGLAYPASSLLSSWSAYNYSNPVDAQEEFFYHACGEDNIYLKDFDYKLTYDNLKEIGLYQKALGELPLTKNDVKSNASLSVDITAKKNDNIYIYLYSRQLDEVSVESNIISTKMDVKDGYILDLGYYNVGDKINIKMPLKEDEETANVQFYVFTIDSEKFVKGYETLKSGQMDITEFNETKISGTFEANENEILYTSIPYDKGWNIILDGEKVSQDDIIGISEALIGVKVNKGKHNITFEYSIPYMNIACTISVVFTLLLVFAYILNKKKLLIFKNKKENLWQRSEGELPEEIIENSDEPTENIEDIQQEE